MTQQEIYMICISPHTYVYVYVYDIDTKININIDGLPDMKLYVRIGIIKSEVWSLPANV